MQLSTPLVWCSMPRACRRKLVFAGPQSSAARTIIDAGTPAIFAEYSGVYFFTTSSTWSKPVVCSRMKSRSTQPRSSITCSMPLNTAMSPPDRTGMYRSTVRAMGVMRGSSTMILAPFSRADHRYSVVMGAHSATLAPAIRITSASRMSLQGLAARSMPRTFFEAAAAETMQRRPL